MSTVSAVVGLCDVSEAQTCTFLETQKAVLSSRCRDALCQTHLLLLNKRSLLLEKDIGALSLIPVLRHFHCHIELNAVHVSRGKWQRGAVHPGLVRARAVLGKALPSELSRSSKVPSAEGLADLAEQRGPSISFRHPPCSYFEACQTCQRWERCALGSGYPSEGLELALVLRRLSLAKSQHMA